MDDFDSKCKQGERQLVKKSEALYFVGGMLLGLSITEIGTYIIFKLLGLL